MTDIIRKRYSYRRHVLPMKGEEKAALRDYAAGLSDARVQIMLLEDVTLDIEQTRPHGRYGRLPETGCYLAGILPEGGELLELGYRFEQVILRATELGLATCWLGGPFAYPELLQAAGMNGGYITMLSPVGHFVEAGEESALLALRARGEDNRKPREEIFSLEGEVSSEILQALEMLRLAPSAVNRQPWQIVVRGDCVRFYLLRQGDFSHLPYDIQRVDMGIALSHFDLTLAQLGIKGRWLKEDVQPDGKGEYIASWTGENFT